MSETGSGTAYNKTENMQSSHLKALQYLKLPCLCPSFLFIEGPEVFPKDWTGKKLAPRKSPPAIPAPNLEEGLSFTEYYMVV